MQIQKKQADEVENKKGKKNKRVRHRKLPEACSLPTALSDVVHGCIRHGGLMHGAEDYLTLNSQWLYPSHT